jgi:hypothetical protein
MAARLIDQSATLQLLQRRIVALVCVRTDRFGPAGFACFRNRRN